jgi:hypothetical protein
MKRYFLNWVYWIDAGFAVLIGRDFRTTLSWNMAVMWAYTNKDCRVCNWFCGLFPKHCQNTLGDWTSEDVEVWLEKYDAGVWRP